MTAAVPFLHPKLPPEVVDLARRSGARTGEPGEHVVLTQIGEMRPGPTHRWAPFRARQSIELDRVGFTWRAAAGPLGCIAIVDALEGATPRMTVKALGLIPLARAAPDAALTKGELQRYLAELPLAPDAILRNAALAWEVLDQSTLRVSASSGDVRAHVDLTLGADGFVASIFAHRPRIEGSICVERPWTGRFTSYRRSQGRCLPFAAEVAWTIGGEEFTYWRGTMARWALAVAS